MACELVGDLSVDIIEPYPFEYFLERVALHDRVNYIPKLENAYELVIAQDVLEHVDVGSKRSNVRRVGERGELVAEVRSADYCAGSDTQVTSHCP